MDDVFTKRDELVLKHKALSDKLSNQQRFELKNQATITRKEMNKINRQYKKIHEEIEEYYYSLSDEDADRIVKPNYEHIEDMYSYIYKPIVNKKVNATQKSDEQLLKEVTKEINELFK